MLCKTTMKFCIPFTRRSLKVYVLLRSPDRDEGSLSRWGRGWLLTSSSRNPSQISSGLDEFGGIPQSVRQSHNTVGLG
jgi:hypothetical protein